MNKFMIVVSLFCAALVLVACSTDDDDPGTLGIEADRIIRFGTPTIDGVISPDEWGTPVFSGLTPSNGPADLMDAWWSVLEGGSDDQTNWADVYFRWDNANLYCAIDNRRVRPNAPYATATATASASDSGNYTSFWIKASVGETTWAPQSQFYKLMNGTDVCIEGGTIKSTVTYKMTFADDSDIANTRLVYEIAMPWYTITQSGNAAMWGDILRIAISLRCDAGITATNGGSIYAIGTTMNFGGQWLSSEGSWKAVLEY